MKPPHRDNLTNERFKGFFKSNFELVNYAIQLGEYKIKAGQEMTLEGLLNEVHRHPNPSYLQDLKEADQQEEEERAEEQKDQ